MNDSPQSVNSQTQKLSFMQLSLLVVLLAYLPESATSFSSHSPKIRLSSSTFSPVEQAYLKVPSLHLSLNSADTCDIVDVDSSLVVPCLDQWVTLPTGELIGIIYHYDSMEMNDGDIIATSPVSQNYLERGMTVVTVTGTQYTLLNRASVEMAQHYNKLLWMDDPNEMPNPPIQTSASSMMTPSTSFAPSTTDKTPEKQDKAKGLLQKVKDAGVSGAISYALWEFAFWALSVPVCLVAYRSLTGHWPDFQSDEDWKQLGGEAFVFVNLARFAVPIRIGLALSTVPWVQTNLVDRFSKYKGPSNNSTSFPQGQQQLSSDQMTAMEEYKQYLQTRSPELRRQLEHQHEESEMSPFEQYLQYRSNRSPELQQQYQEYQQPDDGISAVEEYLQHHEQR